MADKPDLKSIEGGIAEVRVLADQRHPPYKAGGGGGGDMLESRVARLEADMTEVKADLKVIRSDLSELKGKVSMLPGYGGIALIVGMMVAASTVVQVIARLFPGVTP